MSAGIALAALIAEALIGYPRGVYARLGHPVSWMGRLIDGLERRWNRAIASPASQRALGVVAILLVVGITGAVAAALALAVGLAFDGPAALIALAALAVPGLAQRSLYDHVKPVRRALAAGDLREARRQVAQIVGRDTECLDESGIGCAAVESLAESFNDGVVAPAFWLLIGGLPGLYVYKAVNTADSMIGHFDERFRNFGWAAARLDDLLNLVPARLAGFLICASAGRGFSTMVRDAPGHASPNAGWPEAAMAGALGVRLGGAVSYDGVMAARPSFGSGNRPIDAALLGAALNLYVRACASLWILVGGLAWAL
jgi:adenosylcobinamide-phosphate synthase